ncbi:MAG: hypothetical protein ACREOG_05620 [Gemmatimonadaceae bacterium]
MDSSELIIRPTPNGRDILIVGAGVGLTAGLSMALWAILTSVWHGLGLLASFEMIGATFLGPDATPHGWVSALYGVVVHSATAAAFGVLFAALVPPTASSHFATKAGLAFALAILLAMTFVVTPIVNPVLRHGVDAIPKSWIIQHAIFGLSIGLLPRYWRYYYAEGVHVQLERGSASLVRPPQLAPRRTLTAFPRIARARAALKRAEIFGLPKGFLRRTRRAAS